MFKKLFLLSLVGIFFLSCAGDPDFKKEPSPNVITDTDYMIWASSYTPGSVKVDKEYKYIGSEDRSNQNATRKYYVWQKDTDHVVYIVDLKIKGSWRFPEDNDGLLGKKNDPNDPHLLAYKPFQYAVWKGAHPNSVKMMKKLGMKLPKCAATFQVSKISPSRSAAFFVIYMEKSDCDHTQWGGIGSRATSVFTIN